jgi:predicted dehydrogenase/nucleoside-diphosphate-sugar epimerase
MQAQHKRPSDLRNGHDSKTLNVGIIGCGRIAEHHLRFIARTAGARVAALSDPILANARRFADQYDIRDVYGSHLDMLDSTRLDIVHILTPPEYHYAQAVDAIDRGVHVLLEKPCTYHPEELEDLYQRAEARGVFLCPDFIQLFTPVFLRAASLIDSGQLGKVVHLESHLSFDLNDPELREAMGLPWRYNLPGGILHDNITHPLYMVLRWLGKPQTVKVFPQSHHMLPQGLTDHMSIMLESEVCTAHILISAVIKPEPYYIQVFCERGSVLVNFDTSTSVVVRIGILPRFLRRATANFDQARQLFASGMGNLFKFARGRLLSYQGLENLIPRFYNSIRAGGELPVSKELALSVAKVETEIFSQAGKLHLDTLNRPSTQKSITRREKILVTGATGYLGSVVVRKLVKEGYYVRALARELSHTELLEQLGVELIYGDIRNRSGVMDAAKGMDIVVHMAAALQGSSEFMLDCAIKGTRNVADTGKSCNVKRLIYISSMSVYDYFKLRDGEIISEDSSLEEFPQLRGDYSLAKRVAEDEALSHLRDASPSWTILRPSAIVGNGRDVFSPLGSKIGKILFCPGSAKKMLMLIHIDDVAAAILTAIQNDCTRGRVFNVSDKGVPQQEYIDEYIRKSGYGGVRVVYIPYWFASFAAGILKSLRILSRRIPNISTRRLASLYRRVEASSEVLKTATGWQPRENLLQTLIDEMRSSKIVTADPPARAAAKLASSHRLREVALVKLPDDHQGTNPRHEAPNLSPQR